MTMGVMGKATVCNEHALLENALILLLGKSAEVPVDIECSVLTGVVAQ